MPQAKPRRRRELIVNGITIGVIALGVLVIAGGLAGTLATVTDGKTGVGLIEIKDVISDARPVIEQLQHFEKSKTVPVILLRLESPGGSVGASQEIFRQVQRTRAAGKKVVASMGNVAASGAYYIGMAADTIMAAPGTITGSIGVIAEFVQADTLMRKIGVAFTIIQRGEFKSTGTPNRPMAPNERAMVEALIEDAYQQFVTDVHDSRSLSYEALDSPAQGQVFTGRMAMERGLIDTLGNFDDALELARRIGGLHDDAPVVRAPTPRKGLFDRILAESALLWHGPSLRVSYRLP